MYWISRGINQDDPGLSLLNALHYIFRQIELPSVTSDMSTFSSYNICSAYQPLKLAVQELIVNLVAR